MNLKTIPILLAFALVSACSDSADQGASTAVEIPAAQSVEVDVSETADGTEEIVIEEETQVIAAGESEESAEEEPKASERIILAQADVAKPAAARESRFIDGKNYTTLIPTQPTSSSPDKIEVAEIFMFSCPHCYNFEPHILQWLESKPSFIEFVRIPANFNALAREQSRAYYAAVQLGIAEEIMMPFFREFHINRKPLNTPDRLAAFFSRFDVSEEDFLEAFNSFEVDSKVRQADKLTRRYKITGVPAVVINGKYVSGADLTGGYENLIALMNDLAAQENDAKN
ncbi:MAG: thiol:disulfide interchange protein DsbA/DsbL [Gammaproteobacteria bacterium]|nr:thiol:disulfide interchange protein DsbA/DsbL [Gammaproteobacteria bacterium]